jgi:hypothetical protein
MTQAEIDHLTRVPPRNEGYMDESYIRMKKSCDRIAAVLGIKDPNADISEMRKSQHNPSRSPQRTNRHMESSNHQTVTLGNMANPSKARSMSPDHADGQPSGYKSLRDKSPMKN